MGEDLTSDQVRILLAGGFVPKQKEKAKVEPAVPGVVKFTIPGLPIGKPRQTQRDRWAQRPCVLRYRAWADSAREAAGELPTAIEIADLSWTAYFPPPSSWSKKKRAAAMGTLHRSRPDRDNIDKAILDSLFPEDSAIAAGTIRKVWGEPARIEVTITQF